MNTIPKTAAAALALAIVAGISLSTAATASAAPMMRGTAVQLPAIAVQQVSQRIHPTHNPRHCVRTYRKVPDGHGGYTYQQIRFCL